MRVPIEFILFNPSLDTFILILLINIIAYLIIYPIFCKRDGLKIIKFDLWLSYCSLLLVTLNYWNSGLTFYFFDLKVNWFWFYIIHYLMIEGVFLFFYARYFKLDIMGYLNK